MSRSKAWRFLAGMAVAVIAPPAYIYKHPEAVDNARTSFDGARRLTRTVTTTAMIQADYRYTMRGLERDTDEYKKKRAEVHLRSAYRLLDLCRKHGGTYVKLGQLIASMDHALPREYTKIFAELQDKAPASSLQDVTDVLESDFYGRKPEELFAKFDPEPFAVASLAQVHRAEKWNGEKVAVKVQHRVLEKQVDGDLFALETVGRIVEALNSEVQLMWLSPILRENLAKELNFQFEADNANRSAYNFRNTPFVHVPTVDSALSTKRVLTMEFIEGAKISDVEKIKELGLIPSQVGRLAGKTWAEMVFLHGFVHCDPHPGNIFVRALIPQQTWLQRLFRRQSDAAPQLVLLDHGQYRALDEEFRRAYALLWVGLVLQDQGMLQSAAEQLGMAEYAQWLPLIFTYRSHKSFAKTGQGMTTEERMALRKEVRELGIEGALALLSKVPDDMLFVMRTNALLRSTCMSLGGESYTRFLANAYAAAEQLSREQLTSAWSSLQIHLRLRIADFLLWWRKGKKTDRSMLSIG